MKILIKSIKITIVFLILCGVIYPLVGTGIGQLLIRNKANGSIVESKGKEVGSLYLAQDYNKDYYFKGRPSAKGVNSTSGGSNLSPYSEEFKDSVKKKVDEINSTFGVANAKVGKKFEGGIPRDMVTTSGSSKDPDISKEAALYQVSYVAEKSKVDEEKLIKAINACTVNYLGKSYVNVLKLNIEVDNLMK